MTEVEVKKPSKEFLLMMVIQLKNCEKNTGKSMVEWLEDLDQEDPDMKTDCYNDATLVKRIRKIMDELYPPEKKPIV